MAHFSPELFAFLRDLEAHNDRAWFTTHRQRYEQHVREPFLAFIAAVGAPLASISRWISADPRPVGGSLFRIQRDIRFSHDKTPYKTAAAAVFRHSRGETVHTPCFYLHLEPDRVFAGAGLWRPSPDDLARVREEMVAHPLRWRRAVGGRAFRERCLFWGDSLRRPPRGFDPSHPLIEDLKRKDILVMTPFTEEEACAPDFLGRFVDSAATAAPLVRFLVRALGLPW